MSREQQDRGWRKTASPKYLMISEHKNVANLFALYLLYFLQCFDTVGWAAGRASGLKKLSGGVQVWLSVWSKVQTCIRPS